MPRGIPNKAKSEIRTHVSPVILDQFHDVESTVEDKPRVMKSTGLASEALEPRIIQAVDGPADPEKLSNMAFMNEPVEIYVHETSDPKDAPVFDVSVNGRREFFKRGETKVVKRMYVDVLASRKVTTYTQKRIQNADGIMEDVQIPRSAPAFPFSVQRDDNPAGRSWLKYVQTQQT